MPPTEAIKYFLMIERCPRISAGLLRNRSLQGPKLNYTPMENLVLSLVFAAKRLRRTITKMERHAGEQNITYRPRTSVKGQILADFLVEKPDESPPDTSVVETPQEPWTLFTDGSSCVDGSGAGLILTSPEGTNADESTQYALRNRHSWPFPEGTRKGQIFDSRYGLFHKVDRGESRVDNHWQSGEEVRVGQQKCAASGLQEKISNGLVEKANRSLGDRIKSHLGEGNKNWIEELPHVLWAHHTTIKSSHGDTPFSLTYGTEAVIPAEIGMPTYCTVAVDVVHNDEELRLNLDLLKDRRERAAIREAKAKLQMTKYYNARV
ncbi:reverse transcriptase domain-containing protein [Tanacetum coccineum]|uniref:Reverse transcriptase domain-containing protein n=1 Tax=Tanacetum coccineum TaxID=301880 RepID=A0ABQ4XXN9_9ASTR